MAATLRDIWHGVISRKLNTPAWLQQKYVSENRSAQEIADMIGCSPDLVQKKLVAFGLTSSDCMYAVYTGRWHAVAKRGVIGILKPFLKDITETTDEIYGDLTSTNGKIFKQILSEMEDLDKDTESSSGKRLNLARKPLYTLLGKFTICLYDCDSYYSERMDYVMRRIIEERDHLYIDEQSNPENWYPHRRNETFGRHIVGRVHGKTAAENARIITEK